MFTKTKLIRIMFALFLCAKCKSDPIDLTVSIKLLSRDDSFVETGDTSLFLMPVFQEAGLLKVEYIDWDNTSKRLLSFKTADEWMYAVEVIKK